MYQINLSPEQLKETKDTDLAAMHKKLFEKYIKEKIEKLQVRKLVLKLYEVSITPGNIRLYYNRHIKIFTQALVQGQLESIAKYQTF